MFFSFYQNCDFSGCKGSKSAKNGLKREKILSVILHISGTHASYDFHLCIYGTNDNISRIFFFHFIKILILRVFRERGGSKGKKIIHKKLCRLHLVSKEPYIIWLSFVVHKCKLMISPGFFFQNFDFSVKGQKMVQNEKRFCLCNSISQEPYIILSSFVVDKCKIRISPGFCFHFF